MGIKQKHTQNKTNIKLMETCTTLTYDGIITKKLSKIFKNTNLDSDYLSLI